MSTTRFVAPERDVELQGHYAGMVSRLLAWVIDAFTVGAVFALLLGLAQLAVEVVTGQRLEPADYGPAVTVAFLFWSLLYFSFPWAMSGKTVGMAVLGIQVRRSDGSDLDGRHAVIRTIALPLSFLIFGIGLLMGLFQRQQRCLHDFIAGTVVVYSWDARRAKMSLLSRGSDEPPGSTDPVS